MADYTNVAKFCEETGVHPDTVRKYAKRENDPLPVRYMPGQRRYGLMVISELNDWIMRNTCFMNERS